MIHLIDAIVPRVAALFQWLHARLFSSWHLLWLLVPPLIDSAFIRAVWSPESASLCRDGIGRGACWAFVADNYRFILFGTFPLDQQWRPALTIVILVGLYGLSALSAARRSRIVSLWLTGMAVIGVLMWGGLFGLRYVENERWGGTSVDALARDFRYWVRVSALDTGGARTPIGYGVGSLDLRRLYRVDPRSPADLSSLHGFGHAAALLARWSVHRT